MSTITDGKASPVATRTLLVGALTSRLTWPWTLGVLMTIFSVSYCCRTSAAQTASVDTGDGITEDARVHKYSSDPQSAIAAASTKTRLDRRKDFTYTITSVIRIAKPFNVTDMRDDYQDARLISQDRDSATIEFVYYPLNTNNKTIGENPNWKRDYAGMTQYLRPTVTENWDEKMQSDLVAELRADGIDPDKLTDKQLVTQVSHWLMQRNRYTKTFAVWYVYYPHGKPEVFPSLRDSFNREKTSPSMSDQALFDLEVLGRSMFYNRTRGSCTSSAVLMATVMRALGIPTRIVFFIPAADENDIRQREMLLANIHHNAVRATIRHGLPNTHSLFTNHIYNEVFVGNRWVRLNYDVLGQNIVDADYLGLMTHILTTDSLSHVPMAETWGSRYAKYSDSSPKLSSLNPYELLNVSDQFGVYSRIANPEAKDEELSKVTVVEAYWKGALPASLPTMLAQSVAKDSTGSDFYIGIKEFIPHYRLQLREFAEHAGNHFVLTAPGRPEIKATLSGMKLTSGDGSRTYSWFGAHIDTDYRKLFVPGIKYAIQPINTNETYTWTVEDRVVLESGTLEGP